MEKLRRQVRIARRRLAMQRFLATLPWCLFGTLAASAILVAVDKYYPLGLLSWAWPTIGLAAGILLSAALVWLRGQSELDAAIEIDRRFGLHERISSAYALSAAERETPMGQALVADAVRAVERVDVGPGFRLSLSRTALLPLVPAAAAFSLAVFLNPVTEIATATTELAEQKVQVKKVTQVAREKIAEQLKEAKEKDLKEADSLAKLEAGLKELSKGEENRHDALVKMNDLHKQLEERREQLRGGDKLQEQFEQLKNLAKGPADKLTDALKEGDLKQAGRELEALQEKLRSGQLDGQAKAELAKQLEAMERKLKNVAEKQREMESELKRQIAEKRAAGQSKEAEQLEKKLGEMQKQASQMQKLAQMASKMGECSECMKQGDSKSAAAALAQMQGQLSEMMQEQAEGALLDEALQELADAKDAIGANDAMEADRFGMLQQRSTQRSLKPGRGHMDADRPEDDIEAGLYDTKLRGKMGAGAVSVTGKIDGPNSKGRVEQEIQSQFQAARGSASDPLADTKMPRGYREHARTYFDVLRDGEKPAE
ncbi:MAG TPA: hypothetical protein VGN12_20850 [Pirellulales bacterium]|jgi:hypothetical protein